MKLFEKTVNQSEFTIDCTGDVCTGDVILFTESVFMGSYRKPRFKGDRVIAARVLKDSYGAEKQQHTFTIEVLGAWGCDPLEVGTKTTRKGRNVYRNRTMRMPWEDEAKRHGVLDEKHARGDIARQARYERKAWGF